MIDQSRYERGYPEGALLRLHGLVEAVCPIDGVSIGSWDDRTTWRLDAKEEALFAQIETARAIMAQFDPWSEGAAAANQEQSASQENGEGEEANASEGIQELVHDDVLTAYEGSFNEIAIDLSEDDLGLGGVADDDAGGAGEQEAIDPGLDDSADDGASDALGGQGVMVVGDALTTAKAIALMAVDDERFQRVGDYDKAANQSRLDELRQIQQAIREGVHPAFTDEQTEELQALETFLPFMQRIDDHAQALRNAIREAGDLEVLTAVDIISGWPE